MAEAIFHGRSLIFKIGVALIIFWSAVIGFFNIAILFWFGLPILGLLSGVVLVCFSRESLKPKIFSMLTSLPVILISFFLCYSLLPKAEPETFLIPQDFRGYIVVVFDETCGQPLKYENGGRIYDFSENNILITNAKGTLGLTDRRFYLVDENKNRAEIPELHWSDFEREQKDWHWLFSDVELSKETTGVFWAYRRDFSFIISDYRTLEKKDERTGEEEHKIFQNRLESSLKECRGKFLLNR